MLDAIDAWLDSVTMYRLLLYYLVGLLLAAVGLSLSGDLHYNAGYIAVSAAISVAACWIINKAFAAIFRAPTGTESAILTGLILSLIIKPDLAGFGLTFLLAAAGLAMASKYLLTIRHKHIFNPAAVAVALTALGPKQTASWWIGTSVLLPFVIIGGLLLMRKIRRERMVLSFLLTAFAAAVLYAVLGKTSVSTSLHSLALDSGVFFLAFVMLTEPFTSPPTSGKQIGYAMIVGLLMPPEAHIFKLYSSPELALVVGNIFSYIVSPKTTLLPRLQKKVWVTEDVADFVFTPDQPLKYRPGQYMEWTLPHAHPDNRGNRRYLTLASSPTESEIRIGVKFYKRTSSFKHALLRIGEHTPLAAAQLAGDFTLPRDTSEKLVFIAGGIGITPFRSMIKYLLDTKDSRTITLLYAAKTSQDLAYRNIFDEAATRNSLRVKYVLTSERNERIDGALIKSEVPDFVERTFYISGTQTMVADIKHQLLDLGVSHRKIKTDFFPGYAHA